MYLPHISVTDIAMFGLEAHGTVIFQTDSDITYIGPRGFLANIATVLTWQFKQ
jgi:hypothetical protein